MIYNVSCRTKEAVAWIDATVRQTCHDGRTVLERIPDAAQPDFRSQGGDNIARRAATSMVVHFRNAACRHCRGHRILDVAHRPVRTLPPVRKIASRIVLELAIRENHAERHAILVQVRRLRRLRQALCIAVDDMSIRECHLAVGANVEDGEVLRLATKRFELVRGAQTKLLPPRLVSACNVLYNVLPVRHRAAGNRLRYRVVIRRIAAVYSDIELHILDDDAESAALVRD